MTKSTQITTDVDLKTLRFINGLSQEALGAELGITKQQISKIEKGKSKLSQKHIDHIQKKYYNTLQNTQVDDCTTIPVRGDVHASMGYGITIYDETQTADYSISNKLAKDIGVNLKNTEMIFASGDSMEPTIIGGDSLLIDLSKTEVYDGKIYCVRIENKLYAKRLQLLPPKKIKVISDNKEKYDPFYIDLTKNIDYDFAVIGEIRWWGRVAR